MSNNHKLLQAIDDIQEDSFEHHGVKGMKWGVRKWYSNTKLGRSRRAKKEQKAALVAWQHKYGNMHKMTSKDLEKATRRLRLENDFAEQMKRSNAINAKKRGNAVTAFGTAVGKSVLNSVVDSGVKTLTNDLMRNKPKNYSPFTNAAISAAKKLKEEHYDTVNVGREMQEIGKLAGGLFRK